MKILSRDEGARRTRRRRPIASRRSRGRRLLIATLTPLLALTTTVASAQGAWLTLPHLNTARSALAATTAPCPTGVARLQGACVYAIGGDNGGPVATVEAYSPAHNTWVTLPSLPTARRALAAATAPCPMNVPGLKGACVYAYGGDDGTHEVSTVEAYSPDTNRWVTLPSMNTARSLLAGAAAPCPRDVTGLKGYCVYAIGGSSRSTGSLALRSVEAYSPETNRWVNLPPLPTGRSLLAGAGAPCSAAVIGPKEICVYAVGGFPGGGAPDERHRVVESYIPAANVWATLPSLPTARDGLAAAAAPCPRQRELTCVYAVGGGPSPTPLSTTEAYSRAADVWATLPSMPTARTNLAAATAPCPDSLKRICLYAVGGYNGGPLDTVEAFDIEP